MGLFGSKAVSQDHILYSKGVAVAWITDDCLKSQADIKRVFQLVCPTVEPKRTNYKILLRSAKTLIDTLNGHAEKFYAMALATSDAQEWFDSMDVVKRDLERICEIEKYIYYSSANISLYHLQERYQVELRHLIDRSVSAESGITQFQMLNKHKKDMDEKTTKKFQSKYKVFFRS